MEIRDKVKFIGKCRGSLTDKFTFTLDKHLRFGIIYTIVEIVPIEPGSVWGEEHYKFRESSTLGFYYPSSWFSPFYNIGVKYNLK